LIFVSMCGLSHPFGSLIQFPQQWPFSLEWLPLSACLVGGAVRDVLLGRCSSRLDLDFVLAEESVSTAAAIARHYQAGFVLLDAERQIARVVFEQATADFALQVGHSLEADLGRRDFTVNAIAYNPHSCQLHDPLQGYADLQQGTIRMVSLENLQEDPLRLLRAYRQAAQLNFKLESQTQASIRQLAPQLAHVAAERVQTELRYLLNSSKGTSWLAIAWHDGLFKDWLNYVTPQSLSSLAAIDTAVTSLITQFPELIRVLKSRVRDSAFATKPESSLNTIPPEDCDRSWLMIAKLACLLSPIPEQAEVELVRLKLSRAEIRAVLVLLRNVPQVQVAIAGLSLKAQYHLFQEVGPVFPSLAVYAVAIGLPIQAISPLVQRFMTPGDPVAHPYPLVTGQDLMKALHLKAGPQIGKLLAAIQLAQAEGKSRTSEEALRFSEQVLSQ
jgi:tRNA nucleotidyltransferase (CCA-adding enzyme)